MSYVESLLEENDLITNSIVENSSRNLWPVLSKYGIADLILNNQKDMLDMPVRELDRNLSLESLLSNTILIQQLKWAQLKVLRLIQINQLIHYHIERITGELNKAIQDS